MTDKPNDEKDSIDEEIEKAKKLLNDISNPPENKLYLVKRINELLEKVNATPQRIYDDLPTETVYRIMKLEHLIDDIENEVITFTHPSSFDDATEYKGEDALFIQCWTKSPETPAMWQVFAPDKQGIMIKFDPEETIIYNENLNKSVGLDFFFEPFQAKHDWRDIKYDYEYFIKNKMNKSQDTLELSFHKREAYYYEEESRWVVNLTNNSWLPSYRKVGARYEKYPKITSTYVNGVHKRFLQLPFTKDQWSSIISEIIIDPRADKDFLKYATDLLKATIIKHDLIIKQSTFWEKEKPLSKLKTRNKKSNSEILQLYYYSEGRKDLIIKNLTRNKRKENIKLRLLALHDLLLLDDLTNIDYDIIMTEKEMDILLKWDNESIIPYIVSFSILVAMLSIRKSKNSKPNLTFSDKQIFRLVKQMFFLVGSFLHNNAEIKLIKTSNFLSDIIHFWMVKNSTMSDTYFDEWRNIYLESQVKANREIRFMNYNTIHSDCMHHTLYLETVTFYQTITQPYFDSLKEEP